MFGAGPGLPRGVSRFADGVYKFKKKINDSIVRHKARWMIRDFEQQKDLNYNEIFVTMIKLMSYKIFFIIVAVNDWDLK